MSATRIMWPAMGERVETDAEHPTRVVRGPVTDFVHMGDALDTKYRGRIWITVTCELTGVRHPRLLEQIRPVSGA